MYLQCCSFFGRFLIGMTLLYCKPNRPTTCFATQEHQTRCKAQGFCKGQGEVQTCRQRGRWGCRDPESPEEEGENWACKFWATTQKNKEVRLLKKEKSCQVDFVWSEWGANSSPFSCGVYGDQPPKWTKSWPAPAFLYSTCSLKYIDENLTFDRSTWSYIFSLWGRVDFPKCISLMAEGWTHASTWTRKAIQLDTSLVVPLRQVYPTLIPKMGHQKMMKATSLDCKSTPW